MIANLLERATGGKVTWASLIGIVLVPFIVAGGFVWATWNATDRLGEVKAAVVNNDEAVELDGQLVPLGRQLAAGLVDSDEDNFTWVLSDQEDAREGLEDGSYAAVVTIPEEFSEDVTSFGADDPQDARQATIDVQTSEVGPLSDALIGRSIAQVATGTMNRELTENYLDNIYLGFNEMGDQFRTIGDAAAEIAEGTSQLAEGTGESAQGAGELSAGLSELDGAGGELGAGADQLASGAGELGTGLDQLRSGTEDLPESTRQLADGAGELSDGVTQYTQGVDELSDGAGELSDGVTQYTQGVDELSDGAGELSAGVDEYTGGVDQLVEGLKEAASPETAEELEQLETGAQDVADGAAGLSEGLTAYQQELRDAAANPPAPSPEEQAELIARLCSPEDTEEICQAKLEGYAAGIGDGLDEAADGLDQEDPDTGSSLLSGAEELAEGAQQLSDGIQEGLGELLDLFTGPDDQLDQLLEGGSQLRDGAGQLADGAGELSGNSSQLRDGAAQLADGAGQLSENGSQLRDGAGQLADGTDQLADGMPELVDGIAQSADGAGQLAEGADQLAVGLGEYTAGVSQAADGGSQLADGLVQLDDGAQQLDDGAGQLSEGIESGRDEIPSYTAPDRDNLKTVVSQPISQDEDTSLFADASAIALLLSLALWIGGLVTYLVIRVVPMGALGSRATSFALSMRTLLPGVGLAAAQGLALVLLAQSVLKLNLVDLCTLLVFAFFAGAVFAAINHALVAWFGGVGRFIAVAAAVLGAGAHVLGAVPGFFSAVRPIVPITPVFDGVAAIASGSPGLGAAYGALFLWLVLAVTASWAAIARKRTVKKGQLAAALA